METTLNLLWFVLLAVLTLYMYSTFVLDNPRNSREYELLKSLESLKALSAFAGIVVVISIGVLSLLI